MTLEAFTPEKILEDVARLQYLYGLKKVIRYAQDRHETDSTESVAEHIYGMMILAQYFIPLENPAGDWDRARIYEMISLHDLDEIETGDVVAWKKTEEIRALERAALKQTVEKSPLHMQPRMNILLGEYEARKTNEARFVKAIDKIEPLVHVFKEENRILFDHCKTTAEKSLIIKTRYIQDFPHIKRFAEVIHEALVDGDYFWKET